VGDEDTWKRRGGVRGQKGTRETNEEEERKRE